MLPIPNTTTTANYTDPGAAVFPSGNPLTPYVQGFLIVANASAFVSVYKGKSGQAIWTPDALVAPSTIPFVTDRISRTPDVIYGVRARDGVAGTHAQIFGAFFQDGETSLIPGTEFTSTVSSSGGVTPSGGGLITGLINGDSTIAGGTGFTVTSHPSAGVYVLAFTTPFKSVPDIQVTITTISGAILSFIGVTGVTVNGFTCNVFNSAGAAVDRPWNFIASAVS